MTTNPFLTPSTLPYELPPFAEIRDEHYLPALDRGSRTTSPRWRPSPPTREPPTFDNTLEALERSGRLLRRVRAAFFNRAAAHLTPGLRDIEAEVSARLAEHADAIHLNSALYARINALYDVRDTLGLDAGVAAAAGALPDTASSGRAPNSPPRTPGPVCAS